MQWVAARAQSTLAVASTVPPLRWSTLPAPTSEWRLAHAWKQAAAQQPQPPQLQRWQTSQGPDHQTVQPTLEWWLTQSSKLSSSSSLRLVTR